MKKGNYDNDYDEISDVVVYDIELTEDEFEYLSEDDEAFEEFFEELMEMY